MVEINWTDQAIQDIDNISAFIARDSEHYAKVQAKRFFEIVKVLEKQPHYGKMIPEKQESTIRELLLGSYRIIYRIVSESKIDIITIHHSKRLLVNNPAIKNL